MKSFKITTLESDKPLNKIITVKPDGTWEKTGYRDAYLYTRGLSEPITTIDDLYNFITVISTVKNKCIVTGKPIVKASQPLHKPVPRLKHDRKDDPQGKPDHLATLKEQASPFLAVDIDDFQAPGADVLSAPELAAQMAADSIGLGDYSFVYQFSNGQHPASDSIRVRLFFICDKPHTNDEYKRWAKKLKENGASWIDTAIYNAAQIIYTALPEFKGGNDPIPQRVGLVMSENDEVNLVIPADDRANTPSTPYTFTGQTDEIEDLRAALACIPMDSTPYEQKVRIGYALRHLGGSGLELWRNWLEGWQHYKSIDKRWSSFPESPDVKPATIFMMANDHGYKPAGRKPAGRSQADIEAEAAAQMAYYEQYAPAEAQQSSNVTDMRAYKTDKETRKTFEHRIETEQDIEKLYDLPEQIGRSDLKQAQKDSLYKMIAQRTGASIGAIRKDGNSGIATAPKLEPGETKSPAEIMQYMNRHHAVVDVGGQTLIANFKTDPKHERQFVTMSRVADFGVKYRNRDTFYGGESMKWSDFWLDHEKRRSYDGIIFAPGQHYEGQYNLFMGFGIEPDDGGTCDRFKEFMLNVICSGDQDLYDYVWRWAAHIFQKPAELPETALILRSGQGTGKNTFVETLGKLVGWQHFMSVTGLQHVTGRFNGHLADKLLVFANEALLESGAAGANALKAMITDDVSLLEHKGKDPVNIDNYKRLIIAANPGSTSDKPIAQIDMDDRRYIVLNVSESKKRDEKYFAGIKNELANGGYQRLMHELMETDLSEWSPRAVPAKIRSYGWDMKISSANSTIKFWFECLERGYIFKPGEKWPNSVQKHELHAAYVDYMERFHRNEKIAGTIVFYREFPKAGTTERRIRTSDGGSSRVLDIPSLQECRAIMGKITGRPDDTWDDEPEPDPVY